MKKTIIFLLTIVTIFTSCNKNDPETLMKVREIAWNSLSDNDKSSVTTEWELAIVREATFQNKKSYAVTFNTTDDALLGPIVVYVRISTKKVLGRGIRE